MRVSVRKDDPGYRNIIRGQRVYLDGVEQHRVVVADERLGIVEKHLLDEKRQPVLTNDRTAVRTVTRRGEVRIVTPLRVAIRHALGIS